MIVLPRNSKDLLESNSLEEHGGGALAECVGVLTALLGRTVEGRTALEIPFLCLVQHLKKDSEEISACFFLSTLKLNE